MVTVVLEVYLPISFYCYANWGRFIINWGSPYYYKSEKLLLQIGAVLQIGTNITNSGATVTTVLLKILQKSEETSFAGVSLLINFIEKEA